MKRLPRSFYNWTTVVGALLATISFFLILFLIIISFLFPTDVSHYLGIFTYIILPVFLLIGLVLIPIGAWRKYRKEQKGEESDDIKLPKIDLNDFAQRRSAVIFIVGTAIFILATSIGSYEAFHITESNEFCGTLCHKVMSPEYTTYLASPHAKVKCVECHVGSGASWYMKSKLSGMHQLIAVTTNSYDVPIATPVHSLRPARETCEECHWPEKFYDRKIVNNKFYLADETNTQWDVSLLMKVGAEHEAMGLQNGIHWHVNPDVQVDYYAANPERDSIAQVIYFNKKTGEKHVYSSNGVQPAPESLDTLEYRTMDCIDCHNRPSHIFKSPMEFFDEALTAGVVSKDLPDLKLTVMDILYNNEFPTLDSAKSFISASILEYYEIMYEEIFDTNRVAIDQVISYVQEAYEQNVFPEMKAQWSVHPNYIGHLEVDGCFRCHNNSFVSEEGRTISKDCDLCHEIKAQGTPGNMMYADSLASLEFKHPIDVEGKWKTLNCSECHKNLYE